MSTPRLAIELHAHAHHYVSPNNIYSLPGVMMYGGTGIWTVPPLTEIQVTDDTIRIFPFIRPNETIAEFSSVGQFVRWCKSNGRISEPSQYQDCCD